MSKRRFRLKFTFWLDMLKHDEQEIAAMIEDLKGERTFTTAIRDGLRLYSRLKRKDVSVLSEVFEWWDGWLEAYVQERINEALKKRGDDDMLRRMEMLEQALLAQRNGTDERIMQPSGPRPLGAPQVTKPVYEVDDDDLAQLEASKRKDMSTDSAENFLKSMMNLQKGFEQ